MADTELTADEARRLLRYDPETGEFRWRVRRGSTAPVGGLAGSPHIKGYWTIRINYKLYLAHRIAWLMMTGSWPAIQIDHENLDKSDNRWGNLREATRHQQRGNVPKAARNTSGFKGVAFIQSRANPNRTERRGNRPGAGCWVAYIVKGRKKVNLGRFETAEEAHAAYLRAAKDHFGAEFARGE
jgi:hypothetical protein